MRGRFAATATLRLEDGRRVDLDPAKAPDPVLEQAIGESWSAPNTRSGSGAKLYGDARKPGSRTSRDAERWFTSGVGWSFLGTRIG